MRRGICGVVLTRYAGIRLSRPFFTEVLGSQRALARGGLLPPGRNALRSQPQASRRALARGGRLRHSFLVLATRNRCESLSYDFPARPSHPIPVEGNEASKSALRGRFRLSLLPMSNTTPFGYLIPTARRVSPLRQRMIEDMTVRNFAANTQESYLRQVSLFSAISISHPSNLARRHPRLSDLPG